MTMMFLAFMTDAPLQVIDTSLIQSPIHVHFDHGEGDERRTRQRAPVVIATRFDLIITDYFHAARLQSLTEIKKDLLRALPPRIFTPVSSTGCRQPRQRIPTWPKPTASTLGSVRIQLSRSLSVCPGAI
jgi:hypothetical protein